MAAVCLHHRYGGRPKVSSARIIAEALPGVQDFLFGSPRQGGEIGKAPHPFIIIRDDGRDLGLLEHELRDEDGVGIAGAAPGKIAAVATVPGEEGAPE